LNLQKVKIKFGEGGGEQMGRRGGGQGWGDEADGRGGQMREGQAILKNHADSEENGGMAIWRERSPFSSRGFGVYVDPMDLGELSQTHEGMKPVEWRRS
jgi:hypothetical protein